MDRALQWDIFCKVIDNHGDLGVCWRLCADLASRGQQVRLWVDDASALSWMAPVDREGLTVLPWTEPLGINLLRLDARPCDVLIEAFGCDIAPEFLAECVRQEDAGQPRPVWINLEYLSAEPYVERCHGLPSRVYSGPASGWTKWFFYPGFTPSTGGLLREEGLLEKQAGFDRKSWLDAQGIEWSGEKLVSMFCYEPPALAALLPQLAQHGWYGQPVRLLVAAGRAGNAVKAVVNDQIGLFSSQDGHSLLSISYLPLISQLEFDHLLWTCDLNFVRGEDSVVRALWAGKPLVWQIYPQEDNAHLRKLQAFLAMLEAPSSLQLFHAAWNGRDGEMSPLDPDAWAACVESASMRLQKQDDLTTQLLRFESQARDTANQHQ
ncbi:elongation factor P maturation arginine rhamnosyltransferase EarP [Polaromonas sp.]|uniref:elongation factor P maturation arginine rhamnosyltransferase EarP n=1 Tax=Polaromonas sp. TaxID=1869339 RepID=UPI002D77B765|nr:elongation factor P maturation arginine rhamnosyltransferase EarP [Polaromonas sp.]